MKKSEKYRILFEDWVRTLRKFQISNTGNKRLDGAFICPSCGKIHARCFEVAYPFLHMEEHYPGEGWAASAEAVFDWAVNTVALSDGAILNDIDSDWKGTTVFNVVMMLDCLTFHKNVMKPRFIEKMEVQLRKSATWLSKQKSLKNNNINYPITNAYALYYCYRYFGDEKFLRSSDDFLSVFDEIVTENGLILGEGVPRSRVSGRGCRSVDMGYNMEETLPSLALLATLKGDDELRRRVVACYRSHLAFMLDDGMLENGFGTRSYKWTGWGSRTSDGMALGLLLMSEHDPLFIQAASRNMDYLASCTTGGVLLGGIHYGLSGQAGCIHHGFEHAKMFAGILDRGLEELFDSDVTGPSYRSRIEGFRHYPEIDTWIYNRHGLTATISAYDWELIRGGHPAGGSICLLHDVEAGLLMSCSMQDYFLKEKNNMQVPVDGTLHEPLTCRLEYENQEHVYSNIYDYNTIANMTGDSISFAGSLVDKEGKIPDENSEYNLRYEFEKDGLRIICRLKEGRLVLPIVSSRNETVDYLGEDRAILIHKKKCCIRVTVEEGEMIFPFSTERIFNLVGGFEALRIDIAPLGGAISIKIGKEAGSCG